MEQCHVMLQVTHKPAALSHPSTNKVLFHAHRIKVHSGKLSQPVVCDPQCQLAISCPRSVGNTGMSEGCSRRLEVQQQEDPNTAVFQLDPSAVNHHKVLSQVNVKRCRHPLSNMITRGDTYSLGPAMSPCHVRGDPRCQT